jgi:AcrR family transcriptional regulator
MEPKQNFPKTEKAQKRLSQVVNIAHQLFASRGYEEVGIREIAKEAGISPMQVYRLGVDKHDLLAEVILIVNQRMINKIKPFDSTSFNNALTFIENYLLDLYQQDIEIKSIRKEGAAFGWKWSEKYEVLIIEQLMQILKPVADALAHFGYKNIEAHCYAIWSLYYVGYRNAVMNNADANACLAGIKPSLAICLKK